MDCKREVILLRRFVSEQQTITVTIKNLPYKGKTQEFAVGTPADFPGNILA
jgi:hypothetical protein